MGTQDPLVHIEAATLAGGENNQDHYAHGDGWAFVLDGASSFSDTAPVHDGGWYAERLKDALTEQLLVAPGADTPTLVAAAIREACRAHDSATQGPCPTSTIALTRWSAWGVEFYVLGDSYIVWKGDNETHELTDARLSQIGNDIRKKYRDLLVAGNGFGEEHRKLLSNLQATQLHYRNKVDGYWIAADLPGAASHGMIVNRAGRKPKSVALSTDGIIHEICESSNYFLAEDCEDLAYLLSQSHSVEDEDKFGQARTRSKCHDDKTMIRIDFR